MGEDGSIKIVHKLTNPNLIQLLHFPDQQIYNITFITEYAINAFLINKIERWFIEVSDFHVDQTLQDVQLLLNPLKTPASPDQEI